MKNINEIRKLNESFSTHYDPYLNKVKNFDDFLDYLNGDHLKFKNNQLNTNCQPVIHQMHAIPYPGFYKEINLSNCILNLKFTNYGSEILENYKLYINFENVIEVNNVDKRTSVFDTYSYKYDVRFYEGNKGEFIPEKDVLVQNDSVIINALCFRTDPTIKEVNLKWELFARNIQILGVLRLVINPKFELVEKEKYVLNVEKIKPTIRILPKIVFD